jgi:uncharacterized Zn finger protein
MSSRSERTRKNVTGLKPDGLNSRGLYRIGSFDPYHRPQEPRHVDGGVRAQSSWGAFATKWWGRKWIETVEQLPIGARLQRGRNYARMGQVARLDIGKGAIVASVQGTRNKPYRVEIKLQVIAQKQWNGIIARIARIPMIAASMLNGAIPEQIENVLLDEGASLFPSEKLHLQTTCSCPDWSNPCKHIAAVFYLVGEALDQDPFLLFKLRGITKDDFLSMLKTKIQPLESVLSELLDKEEGDDSVSLLPRDPAVFWAQPVLPEPCRVPERPGIPAAQVKKLGAIPLWNTSTISAP